MLRGRARESAELGVLLDAVRGGESRVMVVRGEPGIGKSALLDYAISSASGFKVLKAAGSESETHFAFAALHQICNPILDWMHRLPKPQRDALMIAFGRSTGSTPDLFLIGLGALNLLSEASTEHPLLCVIDNYHVLDQPSAQALTFAARRLSLEPVAMVFATSQASPELLGLPELRVTGLGDEDARAVLASALAAPLDEHVFERFVAETRGNPLALLEMSMSVSPVELAGGFGVPAMPVPSSRIEELFRRHFEALPPDTQQLSLLAAAESTGDPVVVWRAAERLGIQPEASAPAAAAGLLEFGTRVRFSHHLARSVAYRTASAEERLRVHRALAEVINTDEDAARRVWHRALGVSGPDDDIADELERSTSLAQARGGLAAAAAFLARSVELTTDPARRGERALAAAQAKQEAGDPDASLAMLRAAETSPLDELQLARADLVRARVALVVNRGRDAPALLLRAAQRLAPLDTALTRQALLDAFVAALFAGRLAGDNTVQRVARAARRTKACTSRPTGFDYLLDGLAMLITDGHKAATPLLQHSLLRLRDESATELLSLRWFWLASRVAMELWDDESWHELSSRQLELARQAGALSVLPIALRGRIGVELAAGRLKAATILHDELETLLQMTRSEPLRFGAVVLATWRGESSGTARLISAAMNSVEHQGEGGGITVVEWATAVMYNSIGRYADAVAVAESASSHPEEIGLGMWVLPELIEAAARNDEPDRAAEALERLTNATEVSGTHWARGISARSRALLSPDSLADNLYREAIEHLISTRARVDLARAHLIYGEWLRRQRRPTEAREHLHIAHGSFEAMGLDAFANRSARELRAAGAYTVAAGRPAAGDLTSREEQIARLARQGLSNADIGSRLFISPRTVEYHLRKVYTKLGISSRMELSQKL